MFRPPHRALAAAALSLVTAAPLIAETTVLKRNGGWCWYQGPRAIVTQTGSVVFTTISGTDKDDSQAGDLWATSWNPTSGEIAKFELHDRFEADDHNVAGLLERPDGKLLAVYGKHSTDRLQRWRITEKPGDISSWSAERTLDVGDRYCYSNVFRLSAENGRIYNFSRSRDYNPNCTISTDDGETWTYGWRLFSWTKDDLQNNPRFTGIDGSRPYVRYASNHTDTIHFITTEDHPRAYDNSIYHGYYRDGNLHDSSGKIVGKPGTDGSSELKPTSFTEVFQGAADKVAWTTDIALDSRGLPYIAFSVQTDGAKDRTKRDSARNSMDHRYYYARFDGTLWHIHQMAFAGTRLYPDEDDYTGLVALDPQDPDTVVISTNADPVTGAPLISKADQQRHWELFRGKTADGGKSWTWTPLTRDSDTDHLRPVIPSSPGGDRLILWTRGKLKSYTDYDLDVCGTVEKR